MAKGYSRPLIFSFIILLQLVALSIAQPSFIAQGCANDLGNYTSNSAYQTNIDTTFSSISSNGAIFNYGFYNESFGQEPDKVSTIALCRGDVALNDCRGCVRNATQEILQICPVQKQAIGWYDQCMLRYSNRSILGVMETQPTFLLKNLRNVSGDVSVFNQALQDLLRRLQRVAASGDSRLKFASGNTTASFQTIYAVVQCTPDLNQLQCSDCLDEAIREIPQCCEGKLGGRVYKPSCYFWFENERFFDPTANSPPPTEGKSTNASRAVIIIVVPIISFVILVSICIFVFLRRSWKPKENFESEAVDEISRVEALQFDFNTIRVATDNFSNANKLGQGGFGSVYKGSLSNGQEIAVKRLSMGSGQGDLEFKNEVLLVAKLQHRNLVRLLGYSLEGNERLLIYEFLPNTSLDHFIFDPKKHEQLDWEVRYKIIREIARGILYLHEDSRLRIIHRDLKASNILLDAKMNPNIADFGMARLFEFNETQKNTSKIVGTYGYMAPEYAMHGQFSFKSDVFGFGVLILEIVSGKRNNCFRTGEDVEDLLSFAWKNWKEETATNIIDPTLSGSRTEMIRCIHIGLLCAQENITNRPTMASVVLMFNSNSLTLPLPSQPAFFVHSTIPDASSSVGFNSRVTESSQSKRTNLPLSENEVSISELHPR